MTSPVLQALLLADYVYQDGPSQKFIICGVFSVLHVFQNQQPIARTEQAEGRRVVEVPVASVLRAGSPWVYISLTEIQGTRAFELRFVDLSDNSVSFQTSFELTCDDPLQTIQIKMPLPPLPTSHAGTFALELLCDDELVGLHRVLVKQADAS